MTLISATDTLAAGSNSTITAGASAQILAANTQRNGLRISLDSTAASPIYILLGAGTASATNFHICIKPGGPDWDGTISNRVVWRGAVQCFGTGAHLGLDVA